MAGNSRELAVGLFGVETYPDLDDVREAVRAIPEGAVLVSGGHHGPEDVAKAYARSLGIKVRVVRRHRSQLPWVERLKQCVFEEHGVSRLILFWHRRGGGDRNAPDVLALGLEAKRRNLPVRLIKPAGLWG